MLIVQVNPINIEEVPRTAQAVLDRVNTLSFNSSLMREMRAISFVTRLIDDGALDPEFYKRMNVHLISAEAEMARLGASSKLNADPAFLTTCSSWAACAPRPFSTSISTRSARSPRPTSAPCSSDACLTRPAEPLASRPPREATGGGV